MEFFEFADVVTNTEGIRQNVTIDALPKLSTEIEAVDEVKVNGRVIYFLQWGRFHIKSDEVMGGIRFWVPDCPNALAWTVTTGYPPYPERIVIHATINRTDHSREFIDATMALIKSLKNGLETAPAEMWSKPEAGNIFMADLRAKS